MARRTNGEGTIRKRGDNRWEGRYFDPVLDKQRSVYGKTQKEVREKLKSKLRDLDGGLNSIGEKTTVGEWLDIWIKSYNSNIKPLTIDSYTAIIKNHIKPIIGNIVLQRLETHNIQTMYNDLIDKETGKGLSVKTLRNVHGVVHKSMEQAFKLNYIKRNPVNACVIPQYHKKEIVPMDSDTVKTFIKAIKTDEFSDVYFVTLFTGLRQGEVLGLKWDCIDFKTGAITIKTQLQKRKGKGSHYYLTSPKNKKSRIIFPAQTVLDVLSQVKKRQERLKKLSGENWNTDPTWENLVFTNENGRYLIPYTVYNHYKKIVKRMKEQHLRFHDLRHSFAVVSLENGDDIKVIQETLGHHSAAFTLDTYSHVTKLMQKRSADKMQSYIESFASSM